MFRVDIDLQDTVTHFCFTPTSSLLLFPLLLLNPPPPLSSSLLPLLLLASLYQSETSKVLQVI